MNFYILFCDSYSFNFERIGNIIIVIRKPLTRNWALIIFWPNPEDWKSVFCEVILYFFYLSIEILKFPILSFFWKMCWILWRFLSFGLFIQVSLLSATQKSFKEYLWIGKRQFDSLNWIILRNYVCGILVIASKWTLNCRTMQSESSDRIIFNGISWDCCKEARLEDIWEVAWHSLKLLLP